MRVIPFQQREEPGSEYEMGDYIYARTGFEGVNLYLFYSHYRKCATMPIPQLSTRDSRMMPGFDISIY